MLARAVAVPECACMRLSIRSSRAVLLLLLVSAGVGPMARSVKAQSAPTLVGVWRLVSMNSPDATGKQRPYWGEQPTGLIIYTADGHIAAQLYDPRRPRLGVPWESADREAARTAFVGLSTYFGTYTVDAKASTVTHTVEGAMAPDWIGSKLVRAYRFLGPDRIELAVVADAQVVTNGLVLVWQRVQ
jgi:hypothetical protein